MKKLIPAMFLILAAAQMNAQPVQRTFRASINGGGGDGKCTVEVNVDGVAMVEIFGDQGRLITLAGQPSEWRRLQCNQRMPANPYDFRFQGVDGRGRVNLERDPNSNRGTAVIRIEDPQGGREGYTFDIMWRGGADGGGRPGYDERPGYGGGPGYGNGPGYGGGRGRGRETYVVSCASNGRREYCDADTRGGVLLLRARGRDECRQGRSWGFDDRGIWVDRGCKADFQLTR